MVLCPPMEALTLFHWHPDSRSWWVRSEGDTVTLGRFGVTIPQAALQKESEASSLLHPPPPFQVQLPFQQKGEPFPAMGSSGPIFSAPASTPRSSRL